MKKVILFLVLLCGLPLVCLAAPTDDARALLSVAKEIRYTIEAGANYRVYSEQVTKSYIEYKKFVDKHPDAPYLPTVDLLFNAYRDASDVWRAAIYSRQTSVKPDSPNGQMLINRYPSVGKVQAGPVGMYYKEIIPAIWHDAVAVEREFEAQIK